MIEDFEKMKKEVEEWQNEKNKISEIQPLEQIIKLNVGGNKDIEVRWSTLIAVKGSVLEAMFSGRHELQKVDDRIFIDRDPEIFKLVIEFIRNLGY